MILRTFAVLALVGAVAPAQGCSEAALAQRAPAAARAPASAGEGGGPLLADEEGPQVGPDEEIVEDDTMAPGGAARLAADEIPAGFESTYPVYPPAPTVYPLDAEGNPIFGLDIGIEDVSGAALRSFHAALRRAERGEGQARIVVYGAAHVASDTWTGMARRLLQERFGNAGHGFVLPAAPWRNYRHQGVRVESPLRLWETHRFRTGQSVPERFGLAGVAVETADARAFGRVITDDQTASRYELFYEAQPGGGTFDVLIDGQLAGRVPTHAPQPIGAYQTFTVADGSHTFEVRPHGDGRVKLYGVAVEREAPGVILDTLGINGARAASQLQWDEALYQEHLRRRMPDLVVLAYGTNESGDDNQPIQRYEADLRQVVERMQRTVPTASCLLIGPSDRPVIARDGSAAPRARTFEVIAVQRRIAREYGCGFFDLVAFGGGPLHMLQWSAASPAWGASDRIHFTRRAYDRLGQVIANALVAGY
ncbi:MAG: SGNH/GDSL hydrolase family protein [Sandaracinaceae bacterium]